MNKKNVIMFIAITYAVAWAIQIPVSIFLNNHPGNLGTMVFQAGLAVCMFAPLLATLIVRKNLKGMGWKPVFKGNIKWLIFAAYVMIPLAALGGALFYAVFPNLFDMSGSVTIAQGQKQGVDIVAQLEQQGLTLQSYLVISLISGVLIAPFFNIITAIGEEIGWRGYLYPELNKSLSRAKTWILGGIIWSVFHFPAIIIGGYEYGKDYVGSPWLGPVVFTLFCITAGILEEIVYDKTKCIWYPALLHGSINALATIPQVFSNANEQELLDKYAVFGPFGTALLVALPTMILAVIMGIIVTRRNKEVKV